MVGQPPSASMTLDEEAMEDAFVQRALHVPTFGQKLARAFRAFRAVALTVSLSLAVQIFIAVILLLDIYTFLIVGLLDWTTEETLKLVTSIISAVILAIFAVEITVRLIGLGFKPFFTDWVNVIDFLAVVVSIVLEFLPSLDAFKDLVIFVRLLRVARLILRLGPNLFRLLWRGLNVFRRWRRQQLRNEALRRGRDRIQLRRKLTSVAQDADAFVHAQGLAEGAASKGHGVSVRHADEVSIDAMRSHVPLSIQVEAACAFAVGRSLPVVSAKDAGPLPQIVQNAIQHDAAGALQIVMRVVPGLAEGLIRRPIPSAGRAVSLLLDEARVAPFKHVTANAHGQAQLVAEADTHHPEEDGDLKLSDPSLAPFDRRIPSIRRSGSLDASQDGSEGKDRAGLGGVGKLRSIARLAMLRSSSKGGGPSRMNSMVKSVGRVSLPASAKQAIQRVLYSGAHLRTLQSALAEVDFPFDQDVERAMSVARYVSNISVDPTLPPTTSGADAHTVAGGGHHNDGVNQATKVDIKQREADALLVENRLDTSVFYPFTYSPYGTLYECVFALVSLLPPRSMNPLTLGEALDRADKRSQAIAHEVASQGMTERDVAAVFVYSLELKEPPITARWRDLRNPKSSADLASTPVQVYGGMNRVMRTALATLLTDPESVAGELRTWRPIIYFVEHALRRLPTYPTRCYRGVNIRVDPQLYAPGNTISWDAFSSTSTDRDVAINFAAGGDSGTVFVIDAVQGRRIAQFSAFPGEAELLLPPRTTFLIRSITDDDTQAISGLGSKQIIEMAEVVEDQDAVSAEMALGLTQSAKQRLLQRLRDESIALERAIDRMSLEKTRKKEVLVRTTEQYDQTILQLGLRLKQLVKAYRAVHVAPTCHTEDHPLDSHSDSSDSSHGSLDLDEMGRRDDVMRRKQREARRRARKGSLQAGSPSRASTPRLSNGQLTDMLEKHRASISRRQQDARSVSPSDVRAAAVLNTDLPPLQPEKSVGRRGGASSQSGGTTVSQRALQDSDANAQSAQAPASSSRLSESREAASCGKDQPRRGSLPGAARTSGGLLAGRASPSQMEMPEGLAVVSYGPVSPLASQQRPGAAKGGAHNVPAARQGLTSPSNGGLDTGAALPVALSRSLSRTTSASRSLRGTSSSGSVRRVAREGSAFVPVRSSVSGGLVIDDPQIHDAGRSAAPP